MNREQRDSSSRDGEGASSSPAVSMDPDGTVHAPAFSVPLSRYMSDAARRAYFHNARLPAVLLMEPTDIKRFRKLWDELFYAPRLDKARQRYPVGIRSRMMGGVAVDDVTPLADITAPHDQRVLINLHGGGFTFGAGMGGLLESIPIACLAGIRVVSVNYRQGPEYRFPAASEDVAAVYRALLTRYEPHNIGLYGCSAGGLLCAMALAWFQRFELPRPGAVAILYSSLDDQFDGDSRYTTPPLLGQPAPRPHDVGVGMMENYLAGADSNSPLVSPLVSPHVLSRFPPTLLATGTRAGELSSVVQSHAQLIKAGAEAYLHIWEGLWHGFMYDVDLPESKELFDVVVRFFSRHLGAATA